MSCKRTPDITELLPVREYRCEHCSDQVFGNQSHYQLHLRRRHNLVPINSEVDITEYHCPVANCIYHVERANSRSFMNIRFLRQHYQKTHMVKDFKCNECNGTFLLARHLEKHLCCTVFPCHVCGLTYSSKASLATHMRRKNHLEHNEVPSTKVAIPSLESWRNHQNSTKNYARNKAEPVGDLDGPSEKQIALVHSPYGKEQKTASNSTIDATIKSEPVSHLDTPIRKQKPVAVVDDPIEEQIAPVDSPIQPSFYCLPDIEVPFVLQTATQTDDSIDMDDAVQQALNVALAERARQESELALSNFTVEEVERLLRDMETQTDDVDFNEIVMNNADELAPLLRDTQTQTLDNRLDQGTMTDLDLETDSVVYGAYQAAEPMFGPQTSAHMHTQTCDELFEELGLSHIQTQTHWPDEDDDGLYNTQHTQTCDEMLDELLENFQSTCTQTGGWIKWQETEGAAN
ncbi:uncharacterized protein LOC6557357 [Drosophila grimshawi]|uniref:GH16080 n=1 Tax=Drosophila grimshawi TaxID=7222 RepID=B4J347_DROGR|nr:uncharacterized protein LOC6557357 [Drosophila grimshawi]EDV96118.1 GH16080 [Drosophila grimshawi]